MHLVKVHIFAIELRAEVENGVDLRVPGVTDEMRVLITSQIALLVDRDLKGGRWKFAAVTAGIQLEFDV